MVTTKPKWIQIYILLYVIKFPSNAQKNSSIVYMLVWTVADRQPLNVLPYGHDAFIERNCEFQNCFLTEDREYLNDITEFDALLFNTVNMFFEYDLPKKRSEAQEYIFIGLETAVFYPVSPKLDGFFNMTWTYKLGSDVIFPYVIIKNKDGEIIGPKKEMHWLNINDMAPVDSIVLSKLQGKTKAGIWVASNCNSLERLHFVHDLNKELSKYGQHIDIYGICGNLRCYVAECFEAIQSTYYFYMSFENSFAEDYVSEKILHALKNYAVPVVFGGANYTRFMPDGIYLNAMELGVIELARVMNDIINFQPKYENFFKWHSHYSYHSVEEDNNRIPICELCAQLNNKTRRNLRTYYKSISKWWNETVWKGPKREVQPDEEEKEAGVSEFLDKVVNYFFD